MRVVMIGVGVNDRIMPIYKMVIDRFREVDT